VFTEERNSADPIASSSPGKVRALRIKATLSEKKQSFPKAVSGAPVSGGVLRLKENVFTLNLVFQEWRSGVMTAVRSTTPTVETVPSTPSP